MTPILFATICLAQRKIHEVEKLPGYEIQAVALTDPKPLFLETCVRVRGTLPLGGLWSIRVTDILDTDGQPLAIQQPMVGSADVTTENLGPVGFSPMVHHDFPTRVMIKGELVHYMNIEEVASFPAVKLRTQNRASTHVPPNRDWYVPEGCKLSATTPRGLVLMFPPMPSHGYSGPGYDDMSWIPVGPDLSTVNDGLQRELRKAKAQSVSRIDAYLVPGQIVRIYEDNPKAESGIFTFEGSWITEINSRFLFPCKKVRIYLCRNRQIQTPRKSSVGPLPSAPAHLKRSALSTKDSQIHHFPHYSTWARRIS